MPKSLTTEEKVRRLLHPEEMTLEESDAESNRMGDTYQWMIYESIVAERYRKKKNSLPEAGREDYLRKLGRKITFDGCDCVREINGEQRASGASRFFEFKFSGYMPGAKPLPDMRIRLRTLSGIERFVLYQGGGDDRLTVEIDMESHLLREMRLLRTGDIIEFLLPYKIGGKAIKRFHYISQSAWYMPAGQPDVFETPDGNFRGTLPGWKEELFWIAQRDRGDFDLYGRRLSGNDRQRATGTGR